LWFSLEGDVFHIFLRAWTFVSFCNSFPDDKGVCVTCEERALCLPAVYEIDFAHHLLCRFDLRAGHFPAAGL
jgi:hypothetical protein